MSLSSEKVFFKWKEQFLWLDITDTKKMLYEFFCSQEYEILLFSNVKMSVISGSSNLRLSTVETHDSSDCHQKAIVRNNTLVPNQLANHCHEKYSDKYVLIRHLLVISNIWARMIVTLYPNSTTFHIILPCKDHRLLCLKIMSS